MRLRPPDFNFTHNFLYLELHIAFCTWTLISMICGIYRDRFISSDLYPTRHFFTFEYISQGFRNSLLLSPIKCYFKKQRMILYIIGKAEHLSIICYNDMHIITRTSSQVFHKYVICGNRAFIITFKPYYIINLFGP